MSDVSKTKELIAEARFYESAEHVAAYSQSALELLRRLADALEAATRERDAEVAAKALTEVVEMVSDEEHAFVDKMWGTVVPKLTIIKALRARAAEYQKAVQS